MSTLPPGRGIAPDQRGFGEADPKKKIDATRGLGDWADDAIALLNYLDIERTHIVDCSAGGSALWRLLTDAPDRFLSATLVDSGAPFGFGGTKDVEGTPCYDDFAGSGAGLVNRELIQRVREEFGQPVFATAGYANVAVQTALHLPSGRKSYCRHC